MTFLQVKLVCSAAAEPVDLFSAGNLDAADVQANMALMDDLGIKAVRLVDWCMSCGLLYVP